MATTKGLKAKATKAGFTTREIDDKFVIEHKQEHIATWHEDHEQAVVDALEMAAEFERSGIVCAREEDGDFVAFDHEGEVWLRDPDLQDLFASIDEHGGPEEESEGRGSVVPEKYKQIYAERGDPTHCGDFLAVTLNKHTQSAVSEGRKKVMTNLDYVEGIAIANGVDGTRIGKLRSGSPGWQGRFRMTVRNLLTPMVAAKGALFIPEDCTVTGKEATIKAPKEWCLANAPKEKEAGTKVAKKKAA